MALKKSGVLLVAEGDAAFFAVMNQAGKTVIGFGQAADQAGSRAVAMAQRVTRLSDTIGIQNRQLALAERQLAETAQAHGADSIQAQKQQLAIDRLSASIRNNQATLNRLQSELAQVDQAQGRATSSASRLGEVLTGSLRRAGELVTNVFVDIGQAIVAGVGAAVDMAGDYEQSMSVLQAQSGATDAQMEQLRATAQALGADLTLPATSAVDAGQAMLELSKGGLAVDQAMAAAKGTLQLAAAAETDVANAANIATGALAAFGMEGDKAGYIADLLTNAANKSRASIGDVALGFQQAAFRFHSAGQGADDLATSLTILIQAGLGGSDAGTALQNAIGRLQNPTDRAAGLMEELGINVYDASGNMLPMQGIIGVLNDRLGGMTQQERNAALGTIFLGDGMKAMIPLLAAGADGFAAVNKEMTESGSAARMAEARMKGLKGSAEGLQSQIETLALEALEPLLPIMTGVLQEAGKLAGSFVGKVGPAVQDAIGFFQSAGDIISTLLVPAISAAAGATALYAITTLPALIAQLGVATPLLIAQAAAAGLAALPFVAVAAAVGVAALKYQQLAEQLKSGTDQLLESRSWWTEGTAALERYGQASAEAQAKAKPLADNVALMREQVRKEIETLADRTLAYETFGVASGITKAQLDAELATINQHTAGLDAATAALNNEIAAYESLHSMDALETMRALRGAQDVVTEGIQLTNEEIAQLQSDMDAAYEAGTQAIADYTNQAVGFNADLTKAITEGNAEQATSVALNYARQSAAARASIGEQLIAYTLAQAKMTGANDETTDAIISKIEETFGTASTISASTFRVMEKDIRDAMAGGGRAIEGLGGKLDASTEKAIKLREKADALRGQYIMELMQNFPDAARDADALRKKIEEIERRVQIEVHTTYTSSGDSGSRGGDDGRTYSGRAKGGPVARGTPYIVGEKGPELFIPNQSGQIAPPATPMQIMTAGATTINNSQSRTYNYSPTYGGAPRAPSTDFATMSAWGS